MIQGCIFDFDGTLFDTMDFWQTVARRYLQSLGCTPRPDLEGKLSRLTLVEGAKVMIRDYGLSADPRQVVEQINHRTWSFYEMEAGPKWDLEPFLRELCRRGVKLAIATATDRPHIEAALKRTGLRSCFSAIVTCSEVGAGKDRPAVFEAALARLGTPKAQTPVFEDAWHAGRTAKGAGFPLVAVYDPTEPRWEELKALGDLALTDGWDPEPILYLDNRRSNL